MLIQASELIANPGRSAVLGQAVTAMRDVLSTVSGKEWSAWATIAGRPYGSFVLSTRHADYADMIKGAMAIAVSTEWATLAATADGSLSAPAPSRLLEVIAMTGEPVGPKQFTTITSTTLTGTDLGKAMTWSTEVAEHVTKLTGHSAVVATTAAGPMFQVHWVNGVDTAEELDAMNTAMNTDAGYLEMLAQAGAARFFIEGATERLLLFKLP
jgi:hypothetical protein